MNLHGRSLIVSFSKSWKLLQHNTSIKCNKYVCTANYYGVIKIHTEETWFNVNICRMASVCLAKRLFSRLPFIAMLDASGSGLPDFPGWQFRFSNFKLQFIPNSNFQIFISLFQGPLNWLTDKLRNWNVLMMWNWSMIANEKRL